MNSRESFGYVVGIEGTVIRLNLLDTHRGHIAAHADGVSGVTEIGCLFGVDGGTRMLVLRVTGLSFAEPREAHKTGVGSTAFRGEPLRHLEASVVGTISRSAGASRFSPDSLVSPALGAAAYPLSRDEAISILNRAGGTNTVELGVDIRSRSPLTTDISALLGRHVAVLGSTGQGKSCFTAAIVQRLLRYRQPRIVIFDVNGEYEHAFDGHVSPDTIQHTQLGGSTPTFKIPYYALGRHGLSRLLLPSERTQRPALAFALSHLDSVKWFPGQQGAGLVGAASATMFDDGRADGANVAAADIAKLRSGVASKAQVWPHMATLGSLIAESHCLKLGRNGVERDGWLYGNVSTLITRLRRYMEDDLFQSVIGIDGGNPASGLIELNWAQEGTALCERLFGSADTDWKVHIVNLRGVAHDLMPIVLGSLLELFAFELFRRGQDRTYPTLLVLEEAHHYLRPLTEEGESNAGGLAYERLAKEGRKFGLSLWLSTQRPSEVSPTVLSQCGTWVVFRLTSQQDLRAVEAAGEWVDRQEVARIAGLPRREAVVFGSSVPIPVRIESPLAAPTPKSSDPDFDRWV